MSFPPTFRNANHYIEECIKFFDEYKYIFCYPNNEVLVHNVLLEIDVKNLEDMDVFGEDFVITDLVNKDAFLTGFFNVLDKFQVVIQKVEDREFDVDFEAPLSPKKRYEIVNMVKEIGSICKANGCELLVDFGSGLGYLDQLIFKLTKFNVLGLDSNQSHYNSAIKRQNRYHIESTEKVKYLKYTITEDCDAEIAELIKNQFPEHKEFTIIGLHACADLTVEAMAVFMKIEEAKSLVVMPCCYHKMTHVDGKFKYFPLSRRLKEHVANTEAEKILNIPFLRLAAHTYMPDKGLYEMVFDLLVRAVLELYAFKHDFTIQRNKRKAVKLKDRNDFEAYILEAAQNGYTLIPKSDIKLNFQKGDQVINDFNLDELRSFWWALSSDLTFKRAGIFLLMQMYLQPIVENFVLLDRLLYFEEQGVVNCYYKRLFDSEESPRCTALIAHK